jgi:hypothetical protein
MVIYNTVILIAENKKLRAANERIKRKRQKKKSYVGRREVLSA